MNLLQLGHFYINHLVTPKKLNSLLSNINVLLLDQYTTKIISAVSSQSELLNHNIFLIDKISNVERDKLPNMNCIVFLSSDDESINYLTSELKNPKYKQYQVFFANFLTKSQLEKIAASDDLEMITNIQETFWEYLIINHNLYQLVQSNSSNHNQLVSLLLSLKWKPTITYEQNSKQAVKLASEIHYEITNNNSNAYSIFNSFPQNDIKPVLLIVDRKNDPITPLLIPWTYQAMIHEYLTINGNIVDLTPYVASDDDEVTKVVLNVEADKFFDDVYNLNYAELTDKIKELVTNYKSKTNSSSSLNSIDELKNFLQEFPEFKKLSHNVNKHITIASELDKYIKQNNLWKCSQIEQDLSVGSGWDEHSADLQAIKGFFGESSSHTLKLKLLMIYALKYEKYPQNQITQLADLTGEKEFISFFLKYCGSAKRIKPSIFTPLKSNNLIANLKKLSTSNNTTVSRNLQELDFEDESNNSVYMQHRPRLLYILENLFNNKLDFNTLDGDTLNSKVRDVIVYFIDGITYPEARMIDLLNSKYANTGIRIIAGGSEVVNSSQYIDNLKNLMNSKGNTIGSNQVEDRLLDAKLSLASTGNPELNFFGDSLL